MKWSYKLLQAQGEIIGTGDLTNGRIKQLLRLLENASEGAFASLVEARSLKKLGAESLIVALEIERPQKLAFDIRRVEVVEIVFYEDQNKAPEVNCLRDDFPQAPNQNLTAKEFPRQLCLYEQSWAETRLNWTSARFLDRIRHWLARTATGNLHAADQPLEPLIAPSGAKLILPSDFSYEHEVQQHGLLDICLVNKANNLFTLVGEWRHRGTNRQRYSIAAIFRCEPQRHGVIRQQPSNLHELHLLCESAGLNLALELGKRIQAWHREKPAPEILNAELVIVLLLPKLRHSEKVESTDVVAFITTKSIQEVRQ